MTAICDAGGCEIDLEVVGEPYTCEDCTGNFCPDHIRFHEGLTFCFSCFEERKHGEG